MRGTSVLHGERLSFHQRMSILGLAQVLFLMGASLRVQLANAAPTLADPTQVIAPTPVKPALGSPISDLRFQAKKIYERLTGQKVPIDHPTLIQMESLLSQGNAGAAAEVALQDPAFINEVIREMASKMSDRNETILAPLSDFVTTFMGVTRDKLDARLLLTGNFLYQFDGTKVTALPSDPAKDILGSNNHFDQADQPQWNLQNLLIKQPQQAFTRPKGAPDNKLGSGITLSPHPDPAGVITSRAFMAAHATAGTNRRLVEFTFREFMCVKMPDWADTSMPDGMVGRDVDRFPGADHNLFLTSCKGCHSQMDYLRGAFAQVDFSGVDGGGEGLVYLNRGTVTTPAVQDKLNKNGSVFSQGFVTVDDRWLLNAVGPSNTTLFGFRAGPSSGNGMGSLMQLISGSQRFSLCMAKRMAEVVCRRPINPQDLTGWLTTKSVNFEQSSYRLDQLAKDIVLDEHCFKTS